MELTLLEAVFLIWAVPTALNLALVGIAALVNREGRRHARDH